MRPPRLVPTVLVTALCALPPAGARSSPADPAAPLTPLTLIAAIERAALHNETTVIAEARLEQARALR